jgi:LacI family transcriptional regulator
MKKQKSSSRVTIVQVAKEAGVSLGTVSRVINDDVHVADETRERVLAVAKELGYVANRQARGLKGRKTNTIGVLVPNLGSGYIGEIMRGIDHELEINQLDLMLFTTQRMADKETKYVANMMQGMVDGLLFLIPRSPSDYIGTLSDRNFPFVLIDNQVADEPCPYVGATNWQGAYKATEYLIELGHKRIAFITGSMDLNSATDRLEGYKSALRTHHIPVNPDLIYEGDYTQPSGYAGATTLLELQEIPTAVFASNDALAMGAMDAVRNRGLRVPEDISVMGFDDVPQSAMIRPALTTVRQPLEQMGRVATQMIIDILKNPEKETEQMRLPTELIVRDSAQPPDTGSANPPTSQPTL